MVQSGRYWNTLPHSGTYTLHTCTHWYTMWYTLLKSYLANSSGNSCAFAEFDGVAIPQAHHSLGPRAKSWAQPVNNSSTERNVRSLPGAFQKLIIWLECLTTCQKNLTSKNGNLAITMNIAHWWLTTTNFLIPVIYVCTLYIVHRACTKPIT